MTHENMAVLKMKTAGIVSYIFHPLLMPLYGLLVIFFAPTVFWYLPFRMKEILFFIFLINNVLIPLSMLPFLKYRNIVTSWAIEDRQERVIPLLGAVLLYATTSFIMYRLQIPVFIKAFSYAIWVTSVILFIINLKCKVSLHSAGAGAMTAVVFILSVKMGVPLPLQVASSLLLSGVVMSARLMLGKNEPRQAYAGFITGFFVQGFSMLLFQ